MVSAQTHEGARVTIEALQIGAFDFIPSRKALKIFTINFKPRFRAGRGAGHRLPAPAWLVLPHRHGRKAACA